MVLSWWETDHLLLYGNETQKIFRRSIDAEVLRKAVGRCYGVEEEHDVSIMPGNIAVLNGEKIKYYQGTATEESQVPWYAIQKKYYENNLVGTVQEILLLFFEYSKENVLKVNYDIFQVDAIPTQWQCSDDKTRYRVNYRSRKNTEGQGEYFILLDDGSERVMKTAKPGIRLDGRREESV